MQFDPTLYVITDSTYHTTETLLHAVDEACRGGATLIQLREKDTGGRSYLELAQQVVRHGAVAPAVARTRLGEQLGQNRIGNRNVAGGKGVEGHGKAPEQD